MQQITTLYVYRNIRALPAPRKIPPGTLHLTYDDFMTYDRTLLSEITEFHCRDCGITVLPETIHTDFPKLRTLKCAMNRLTTLPSPLPPLLRTLDCYDNFLTTLPPLPDTLTDLKCNKNRFVTLPTPLPPALKILNCGENTLSILPPLPHTLTQFWCVKNKAPTGVLILPYQLPPLLLTLILDSTRINTLPDPLPPTLEEIDCWNTGVEFLPDLPKSIVRVVIDQRTNTHYPLLYELKFDECYKYCKYINDCNRRRRDAAAGA